MEKLCECTEELLSDMLFCGFENVSAEMIGRLDELSEEMNELGMDEGCRIAKSICSELSEFRRNENDGGRICGLVGNLELYIVYIMQNSR